MDVYYLVNTAIATTIAAYRKKENISMDTLADRLGITPYVFKNKACPTNEQHQFKTSQLVALVRLTGDTTISRALGAVAERTDDNASAQEIVHMLLDLGIDQGNALEVIKNAIADGKITQTEMKDTIAAIAQSIENYRMIEKAIMDMAGKARVKRVA